MSFFWHTLTMIKSCDYLPDTCIGDIIKFGECQYVVIAILSVFMPETEDTEPTVTYKVLIEKLIGIEDN